MQSLNEKEWREFDFAEIFDIKKGFYNKKPEDSGNGTIPFLGATDSNNGVTRFLTLDEIANSTKTGMWPNSPLDKKLFPGHAIAVTNNGSVGHAYYQATPFTCSHDINPLYLRDHEMSRDEADFLIKAIEEQGKLFQYARKWRPIRMVKSKLMLPITNSGEPDYAYMAEYAQQKRDMMLAKYRVYIEKQIAELGRTVEIPALDEKTWRVLHLEEIGTVAAGRDIYAAERREGDTPYITSGGTNNGVGYFVGNMNETLDSGYIAVNRNGSVGKAFYHPSQSLMSNDCRKVHLKSADRNLFIGQFVALCLSLQRGCFSYSRKLGTARAKRMRLMLPVTDSGEPDYEYMEQYVKNMMLRKYQQYLTFLKHNKQNT